MASLYNRRVINVNVNVIVAGVCALLITIGVMHLGVRTGLIERLQGVAPDVDFRVFGQRVALDGHKLVISGLTLVVDLIADIAVYYGLHWLANHMPRRAGKPKTSVAYADLSFLRDATLVQFERAVLSPLLYVIALGLQNTLLHNGVRLEIATAWGFLTGIAATRAVHTMWMLRMERRAVRRLAETGVVLPEVKAHGPAPVEPASRTPTTSGS